MNKDVLLSECNFKAVRSSGPGGQHVNKTSTKVLLTWDVSTSQVFNEKEKDRLRKALRNRLTKEDVFQLQNDASRSQHKNKNALIDHFFNLLQKALVRPKKRKKTKIPKKAKRIRLQKKKRNSEKKANRKPPDF